ncbi:uncharacterized protein [Euwallacea fornicatus]|uniref:uncharacterized protein n=1 Tax=Euwallacea fornicatus TaxID=995702 RepID=UPI00338EED0B
MPIVTIYAKEEITLVNYVTKPNKCVILLSTMHNDKDVIDDRKTKPESTPDSTKSGVDFLDQKARISSCKRQSRRWPVVFFSNMLDVAGINSWIIFDLQRSDRYGNVSHKLRLFLKDLTEEMTT